MTKRLAAMGQIDKYAGLINPGKNHFNGVMKLHPEELWLPLERRKATTYFVNSMSDLFHEGVPFDFIDQVFAMMALAGQHTFQVLTKRPERARAYLAGPAWAAALPAEVLARGTAQAQRDHWPLPNVWLGTSISDQASADQRIPELLACPAAVRFLSIEPMLGPVDILQPQLGGQFCNAKCKDICLARGDEECPKYATPRLDWVIVGGESGPHARAMHPDWARSLRDQCAAAEVAFLFKQWGEWLPLNQTADGAADDYYHPAPVRDPEASRRCKYDSLCLSTDGADHPMGTAGNYHISNPNAFTRPGDMSMYRVGKARAGRLLDGAEHNGFPGYGR